MAKSGSNKIPPPKGTRDLYPQDLLRQRYITEAWRRVSIRHGFDEIAGPTFEMLDLYKKKSGDGIVSELFSFTRAGGDDDYALRPEFTPTLARMYAEKAKELPTPCKWFTAGPYFRAEKPQRGRLREFMQWNCDVIGGEDDEVCATHDCSLIGVLKSNCTELGLRFENDIADGLCVRLNHRGLLTQILLDMQVPLEAIDSVVRLLDARAKLSEEQFVAQWAGIAGQAEFGQRMWDFTGDPDGRKPIWRRSKTTGASEFFFPAIYERLGIDELRADSEETERYMRTVFDGLRTAGKEQGVRLDVSIARGLAYYTGTVFELIADGERAVAGGGRYDNLIELFGGPPTPAVGFGMGDVVLGLLLEDKGLMPEGPDLADALSQKPASIRPEAFVIANEEGEPHVEPLLAELRRGTETDGFAGKPWDAERYCVTPMHARRSYKSTKNIGKLLADARKQHARFAVIIENNSEAKIENLETRQDLGTFSLGQIGAKLAELL